MAEAAVSFPLTTAREGQRRAAAREARIAWLLAAPALGY